MGRLLSWEAPLVLGGLLLCLEIGEPWTGSYDANGALFSTVARNYLRYGLAATRGGQVVNAGALERGEFRFYAHHPPGLPLAMAASFALFGVHEWSARLVPIVCTLGAAALLYLVAREMGGPWAGFFATLAFVAQPMVAFYGRMPDHEAPGALVALALAALYLRWRRTGGTLPIAAMSLVVFVGVWFTWLVVVVPWLLVGCGLLARGRRAGGPVVAGVVALAAFASALAHVAAIEGDLAGLWAALVHRLSWRAEDGGGAVAFGLWDFARRQGTYCLTGFGVSALVAAGAWVLGVGRRRGGAAVLVVALGVLALVNIVGFKQGAYVHIYYQFYAAIPLALMAGLALGALTAPARRRRGAVALAAFAALVVVGEGGWKLRRIQRWSDPLAGRQMAVAALIRQATSPTQRLVVHWRQRASFRQLTYYADRDITVASEADALLRAWADERHTLLVAVSEGAEPSVSFLALRKGRSRPLQGLRR